MLPTIAATDLAHFQALVQSSDFIRELLQNNGELVKVSGRMYRIEVPPNIVRCIEPQCEPHDVAISEGIQAAIFTPAATALQPSKPNPNRMRSLMYTAIQALVHPWAKAGVTERLLASQDMTSSKHHHKVTCRAKLRQCLTKLLQSMEHNAPNAHSLLTQFQQALQECTGTTEPQPSDPVEFIRHLVHALGLGLEHDSALCSTLFRVSRTLQSFSGGIFAVGEPMMDIDDTPQLMLTVLESSPSLQVALGSVFPNVDAMTNRTVTCSYPLMRDGETIENVQTTLMAPAPQVMSVVLPATSTDDCNRAVQSIAYLEHCRILQVPVTSSSGFTTQQSYQVESVVCSVPEESLDVGEKPPCITLKFEQSGIYVCEGFESTSLKEYLSKIEVQTSQASASSQDAPTVTGTVDALQRFFEVTGYVPHLVIMTAK